MPDNSIRVPNTRKWFVALVLLVLVLSIILAGLIASVMQKKREAENIPIPVRSLPQAKKKDRVPVVVPVSEPVPVTFILPITAEIGQGIIGRSNLTNVGSARK